MNFSVSIKGNDVGVIKLSSEAYDVSSIKSPVEKKKLSRLLDDFYKNGVTGVAFPHDAKKTVIKISENEKLFFLELGLKLKTLGYTIK